MNNLVPFLRFPEFKDSGEWVEKKLGDVADCLDNLRRPLNDEERQQMQGEYPYWGANNIMDYVNQYIFDETIVLLAEDGGNFNDYATRQIANLSHGKCWVNNHTHVLRGMNTIMNNEFLFYSLVHKNITSFVSGGTRSKLTKGEMLKILIRTSPSLPEQTKIATFLTSIDERIEALSEQLELTRDYKKGMMQRIFSQEYRFKDDEGNEYPEWVEKKLGEVCRIKTGKLDANAMEESGQYRFYTCAKEYYQINEYAFDTDALIISGNGANVGYIHHFKGKFNAYQRTYVLDNFLDNIMFIKYFLDKYLYVRIFIEKKEGNTPYIVMNTLTDMELFLPHLEEQTKIATFLSSVDERIEALSEQLEQTKLFKKAMLQRVLV